jgi:hypothetical protein
MFWLKSLSPATKNHVPEMLYGIREVTISHAVKHVRPIRTPPICGDIKKPTSSFCWQRWHLKTALCAAPVMADSIRQVVKHRTLCSACYGG